MSGGPASEARAVGADLARFLAEARRGLEALAAAGPVAVGPTPSTVVARRGKTVLHRYREQPVPGTAPLLIVYSLVNRPYLLDLEPGRSFIRRLLDHGLDPHLIDWGYASVEDRQRGLEDYLGDLDALAAELRAQRRASRVDLLGVCQGGTFALVHAALHPATVRRLVLTVTPVDFHTPGDRLARVLRRIDADALARALGNVPGELAHWAFVSLRPLHLAGAKYLDMLHALSTDEDAARTCLRMERWIHDQPDLAGRAFREFVGWFYRDNALVRDRLRIAGRAVRLGRVRAPVLNVFATGDHIVPPAASLALADRVVRAPHAALPCRGGHVGVFTSRQSQHRVAPAVARWLREP